MKLLRLLSIVSALLASSTLATHAAAINLSYSGSDDDDPYITSLGSGNFTFANGTTSLTLANLLTFQFTQRTTSVDQNLLGAASFTYSRSDLISFSATLSATGAITALSFQTGYVNPTNSTFSPDNALAPEYFVTRSLSRYGASTYNGPHNYDELQTGTVVANATVPEPSSLLLAAIGGLGGVAIARVRKARAHHAGSARAS